MLFILYWTSYLLNFILSLKILSIICLISRYIIYNHLNCTLVYTGGSISVTSAGWAYFIFKLYIQLAANLCFSVSSVTAKCKAILEALVSAFFLSQWKITPLQNKEFHCLCCFISVYFIYFSSLIIAHTTIINYRFVFI